MRIIKTINDLPQEKQKVGRCSLAWLSVLSTEVRQAIDRLNPQKEKIKNEEVE